jgi:hypothetical protein
MGNIRVKQAQFFYVDRNQFNLQIDTITGYGNVSYNNEINNTITGQIVNPTGLQPAVFYKTGLLTENIINGGSFTWQNTQIAGTGESNKVYLNYITGYVSAQNEITFINSTGSGLQNGDLINIANFSFTYNQSGIPPLQFNSPQNLINILNSGATGGFNAQGFTTLQNTVGVTGFRNNNSLELFSVLRSGENGNSIRIYRDSQNLDAIKIASRYFTGGKTFRPLLNNWVGNFSNTFTLTVENSGFYTNKLENISFGRISGVAWEDNFTGNYLITTGVKSISNIGLYSGTPIPLLGNKFVGSGIIPSGQLNLSIINIDISKPNPYNLNNNLAKYIFSGQDFIFSQIII